MDKVDAVNDLWLKSIDKKINNLGEDPYSDARIISNCHSRHMQNIWNELNDKTEFEQVLDLQIPKIRKKNSY